MNAINGNNILNKTNNINTIVRRYQYKFNEEEFNTKLLTKYFFSLKHKIIQKIYSKL